MVDALLDALRNGLVSAREAADTHLHLLHEVHERTGAVAWFADERALDDAAALDRAFIAAGPVGPLHGLPITVKDWIDVKGFPCAGGSPEHRERRPDRDATVVARLRAAGAVVLAKTAVWDGLDPERRTHHPDDPSRTPGGSSSGEAVVVAAGASPLGIGSDSGGSIRLPAAWCGVHGFKPTAGLVPTTGHFPRVGPRSDGRTQIGPLARSVDLIERVLQVISGPDGRDGGVAPVTLREGELTGALFAVLTSEDGIVTSAEIVGAVEAAAETLSRAGLARVEWSGPWLSEALDITRRYWARADLSGEEADRQLQDWDRFTRKYLEAAAHVDFLLTPATREVAPLHRRLDGDDFVFTLPASLTGSPAMSVNVGRDSNGRPLAVQIVGRPWEDRRVLSAARQIAASSPTKTPTP